MLPVLIVAAVIGSDAPAEALSQVEARRQDRPLGARVDVLTLALPPREPGPVWVVGVHAGGVLDLDSGGTAGLRGGVELEPEVWVGGVARARLGPAVDMVTFANQSLGEVRFLPVSFGPAVEACLPSRAIRLCSEVSVAGEWVWAEADGQALFRTASSIRAGLRADLLVRLRWAGARPVEPWLALGVGWRALVPELSLEGVPDRLSLPPIDGGLTLGVDFRIGQEK